MTTDPQTWGGASIGHPEPACATITWEVDQVCRDAPQDDWHTSAFDTIRTDSIESTMILPMFSHAWACRARSRVTRSTAMT